MLIITSSQKENDIEEELSGAEKYYKEYLASGDVSYREMANDELKHAGILIKKHLINADETEKLHLTELEHKRLEMLKNE